MTHRRERILVAILLVVAASYAVAEDLTLTTYYPSPRGVYNELRVGSGATSVPSATLQVAKPLDDGNFAVRVDDQAGDTSPFVIDQRGRVAMGTDTPYVNPLDPPDAGTRLTVNDGNIVLQGESGPSLGGGTQNAIFFGTPADGYYIGRVNKGTAVERLQISAADNPAPTTKMLVMDTNGDVGIGTSDPKLRLDVNGSIVGTKNLYFKADTGLYLGFGELTTALADWPGPVPPAAVLGTNLFGMGWDKVSGAIGMVLPAGSNFDISNGNLTVSGSIKPYPGVGLNPDGDLDMVGPVEITGNLAVTGALNLPPSASPFTIARNVILGAGNSLSVNSVVPPSGTLTVSGTVFATSDARLKTDLLPVNGALDKVEQLRGMSFAWDPAHQPASAVAGMRHIGVIAQDVEAAFPELVSSWGPEGYKAVDYGGLTAVLLEAIKELRQENATLQQRLELLERRMETQEDGS